MITLSSYITTILIYILSIVTFILILIGIALFCIQPNWYRDASDFTGKLYAHRGLHGSNIPENSLTAFRLAREKGYGVELDVQMTKDFKLVVFHDATLKRMCGVEGYLRDYTYEELQAFSLKGTKERIPLFEEVLKELGETTLICELKSDNGIRNYEFCNMVDHALSFYQGKYCIESFSPFLTGWFSRKHPEIIRGQLSCDMKNEQGQNAITNFLLTNLLLNCVSRPDFIAYNFKDTKCLGYQICKRLYKPHRFAWTPRGKEEIELAMKEFDTIIFEEEKRSKF
ncbi:MAG: glycerophosphodiester phosphodiesterase [Clostridia bacterium]|mgnify:CR=1 FL=1|nr:glycerophosphodiester phosphodiesterase [Clostridia bacterium]